MPEVVIASWNLHAGVDGWGRPFDVVGSCRALEADVLVLQETWAGEEEPPLVQEVAGALGFQVVKTLPIGRAAIFPPPPSVPSRWGPRSWDKRLNGMRVDRVPSRSRPPGRATGGTPVRNDTDSGTALSARRAGIRRGQVCFAILTRLQIARSVWRELGSFGADSTQRSVIAAELCLPGPSDGSATIREASRILVSGTHLSHLRHGSLSQLARLRELMTELRRPDVAQVVAGDLNLPGPAVSALMPGYRRAVRGRSWPAWRPLAQPDHLLVRGRIEGAGEVLRIRGSDHLPVRARFTVPDA